MAWVLFFDGDCAFCSRSVQRAFRLDREGKLSFAPLQGKLASEMGFAKHAAKNGGTMVVLRESDGKVFFKSDPSSRWRGRSVAGGVSRRSPGLSRNLSVISATA